jgi:glycerol kinase
VPVLAIDQGTSSTKALVVGPDGAVLAGAEIALRPHYLADGGVEQDPKELFLGAEDGLLRRHVTTDGVVTTTDTWLIHHLTGRFLTDAATVSRSLLSAVDTVSWDAELLSLFGLDDEALPEIVGCDEVVGSTGAFGGDAVVGGLVVDQQAALLAQGCLSSGSAKCTFGTGAFVLAHIGATASRSRAGLTTSVAWRARGRTAYCLDGQVYTVASAVRWMQSLG